MCVCVRERERERERERKREEREEREGVAFSTVKVYCQNLTSEGTVKSCTVTLLACTGESNT